MSSAASGETSRPQRLKYAVMSACTMRDTRLTHCNTSLIVDVFHIIRLTHIVHLGLVAVHHLRRVQAGVLKCELQTELNRGLIE